MAIQITTTRAGRTKLAAAIANKQALNITQIALGDGNGNTVTPTGNETALKRERHRQALASLLSDGEAFLAQATIAKNIGGFTLREVGLFDIDGVLIAYGNTPIIEKTSTNTNADIELHMRLRVQFI